MASATKLQTYENFSAKSEDYYCNAEENDQIYEAVEPVDGTEDTSAKVETNKNLGQGKKHVQPQTVEQMELNFMSEHGANARRTSVSLDTGIKLSRLNRWLGRLLAATCILSALTIGCWIAIGMLFMQSADGSWGSWSSWSLCSKSCGVGLKHRRRTCNNPEPVAGGKYCDGDPQEFDSCETRTCALNGNWGAWSSWSLCSKSCGVGLKRRRRTCNNSEPVAGAKYCDGDPQEFDSCETRTCAAHVAFYATLSNGSSTAPVVFNRVELNDGNGYSNTTGIFTAPVGGRYLFSVSALSEVGANVYLYKNDDDVIFGRFFTGTGSSGKYNSGAFTCVKDLNQGDQVKITSDDALYSSSYTSFSGVLLIQ